MGEPQSHQGGMLALNLAGLVAPPEVHQGRLVTIFSPHCYLNVPFVDVAVGLRHQKLKGRALRPGMCPVWGLGEGPALLGPQFPCLAMLLLG